MKVYSVVHDKALVSSSPAQQSLVLAATLVLVGGLRQFQDRET